MKTLLAALALTLATGPSAVAFDAATQAIIDRHKPNKPVNTTDIAQLMRATAQWCYDNQDHTCAWTDIYLEVTDDGFTYEIGNAWNADTDVAFTDHGVFRDNRYLCETGYDWVPTIRATRRSDGSVLAGRLLWELKQEIYSALDGATIDCFDYLFRASNPDQLTVTLLQRQYTDDVHIAEKDVEVTLHMSEEDAAGLLWRW